MNESSSTVIRSEAWVNKTAKECLAKIEVAREKKEMERIENGKKTIQDLKLRSFWGRIGWPKLPKEITDESVEKWLREADSWAWVGKDYYREAEHTFKLLIDATRSRIPDRDMYLSTEDSARLEKWINWKP